MTDAPLRSPSSPARRRAARVREFRRIRILAMVQAGWSNAAIGREEAISRERLLAKLNAMAECMIATRRAGLVDADGRPRQGDDEAALDVTDGPDFIADPAAASSAGLDVA